MAIYEVTARITIEADSAPEAVELFDSDYRDSLTVVHLQAREVTASEWADVARGERRNSSTAVYR